MRINLHRIDEYLNTRPKWLLILVVYIWIGLLGALDYITSSEISFTVSYLLLVALTTWYVSFRAGLAISLAAASTMLAVDYISDQTYSQAWIPYWNIFSRFVIFLFVTHLLSTLKANLSALQAMLRVDTLTGVKSLHAFEEEAGNIFKFASRYRQPISLGFIDLDGFKLLNDSKGHAAGNEVLKVTGAQLMKMSRSSDIVARIGGDEFVVLLPQTDKEGAEGFFSKLHAQLLQTMKSHGWNIGFSVGVAVFPDGKVNLKSALTHADDLMYAVKKGGKNSVLYSEFSGDT